MSKNFARSAVVTAPSPATSGTTVTVTAGHGTRFVNGPAVVFPADADPTPANAEVVTISGISTDTLTIARAAESSTARTIVAGDRIHQGVTAAQYDALVSGLAGKLDTTAGAVGTTNLAAGAVTAAKVAADVATQAELDAAISGLAPLASPALTGNPTAPTPAPGDNDTSVATTAFVQGERLKGLTATGKTTTYTAVVGDFVQADATSAGFTVTLPAAPTAGSLVAIRKVDSSANVVTVVAAGGGTIDGDANATIITQWAGGLFQHVGSNNWQIVSVTQVNFASDVNALQKAQNLSDLTNAATARTNLGLGTAAVVNTGTTSGSVALLGAGGLTPTARLGTGTAAEGTFLRGDGTWAPHLVAGGASTTIAAGGGAGTTPTIAITGADLAGKITLTTGTTPGTSSTVATVTFGTAYTAAPVVVLTPGNAAAAALTGAAVPFVSATSTTTFTLTSGSTALAGATQYVWNFHVIGV